MVSKKLTLCKEIRGKGPAAEPEVPEYIDSPPRRRKKSNTFGDGIRVYPAESPQLNVRKKTCTALKIGDPIYTTDEDEFNNGDNDEDGLRFIDDKDEHDAVLVSREELWVDPIVTPYALDLL